MATRTVRSRGRVSRKTVVFAIAASAFAILMSALTAYDDLAYQGLHTLSLVVMLLAFLGVIGSVLSSRQVQQEKIVLKVLEEKAVGGRSIYQVVPSKFGNFVSLEPPSRPGETPGLKRFGDQIRFPWIKQMNRQRCDSIRIAVVRNAYVDVDLIESLMQFSGLVVIDIQGCFVDPDAWAEFAYFDRLEYLAVHGAIDPQSEKELHYTLPEVKPITESVVFVHSSSDTV